MIEQRIEAVYENGVLRPLGPSTSPSTSKSPSSSAPETTKN